MKLSAAAADLFSRPAITSVRIHAGGLRAGMHRWMGQPLATIPEAELREILGTLEQVAWGEIRTDAGRLTRQVLMAAIYELDEVIEPTRGGPAMIGGGRRG